MTRSAVVSASACVALLLTLVGAAAPTADRASDAAGGPFRVIPKPPKLDAGKVALGRRLFESKALSKDGTVSCASCHDLSKAGADGRSVSIGIGGRTGRRNAPTVFNAALQFAQFWDGRAPDLAHQVDGPLSDPVEMGGGWEHVLETLRDSPEWSARFDKVYGGVEVAHVRDALATFQRTLLTPDSPFDRFLGGEEAALSDAAREGLEIFDAIGCVSCHQGVLLGGNLYQSFVPFGEDPEEWTPPGDDPDLGRFERTRKRADRNVFKVPGLRNVAVTPPYFHDGSAPDLKSAIKRMIAYQLGRRPRTGEVEKLEAFLESLTGTHAGRRLTR